MRVEGYQRDNSMKKLLLVTILLIFSHSSFSAYKNIKDIFIPGLKKENGVLKERL